MLVVVLAVLLVGYVANDRVMAWDEDQKFDACQHVDVEDMPACWQASDRWPIDF